MTQERTRNGKATLCSGRFQVVDDSRDEMVVGDSSSCADLNGAIVYYFKQATNPGRNNYAQKKELESEIKDIIISSHSTPTLKQQCTVTTPVISVNSLEKKEELLMSWMSRSNNSSCSEADPEESCDEGPVLPTHLHPTSFLSPLHESELSKSVVIRNYEHDISDV